MATLGHKFTSLLGFKEGKDGAIVLGISAAMMWELTAVSLAVGLALLAISRHMVWSITGAFVAPNTLTILTSQPAGMVGLCLSLSFVVAGTHLLPGTSAACACGQETPVARVHERRVTNASYRPPSWSHLLCADARAYSYGIILPFG